MMEIKILLFAGLAEKLQQKELILRSECQTVADVTDKLLNIYPELQPDLLKCFISKNEVFCKPSESVETGDTIAFIPPVSGG